MEHQWSVSCCERYSFSVIHQIQGLDVANTGGKKLINKAKIRSAELENKWVTCLSRASSLLLFAFPLCFQFSKFSHLNLSSFILQSPRNASVTMQLLCRCTHKYEKNAGTFCLHWGWLWLFVGEETSCASKERLVWRWKQNTEMVTFAF